MNKTKQYFERLIKRLNNRNKPKGQDELKGKQTIFYKTIKEIVHVNNDPCLTHKQIKDKYKSRREKLNLLPTDFCYDKVNLNDNEKKFLISGDRGEFQFVDFHWSGNGKRIKITWTPAGKEVPEELKGKPIPVGKYRNDEYTWDFSELEDYS